jgi:hypothetical protein
MSMRGENEMVITVEKTKLLEILKSNREKHLEEYRKARLGYMKAALFALEEHQNKFAAFNASSDAKLPDLDFSKIPKPRCFAESYTRTINMLELHQGSMFTVDMAAYRRYVEDEWEWKGQHHMSNSHYLVS